MQIPPAVLDLGISGKEAVGFTEMGILYREGFGAGLNALINF